MRALLAALKSLVGRSRFEREMEEELRLHIEHRADDLMATGLVRDEALCRARIEFGAVERFKEDCRDASGFSLVRPWHGMIADLRLAARRLAAAPLFTAFAVLSLGVGVGLTTAVYSIVDAVFWKDEALANPDATVLVTAAGISTDFRWIVSREDYLDFRSTQQSFDLLAASHVIYPAVATSTTTEVYQGEGVDAAYFQAVGVSAAIGRVLLPEDDDRGSAVVVLSHALWQSRFGADPSIVGATVRVSGRPFEIVGVAPRAFEGLMLGFGRSTRLWVPLAATADGFALPSRGRDARGARRLTMVGRLAPGRSLESAAEEIAAVSAALDRTHPMPAEPRSGRAVARAWAPVTMAQLRERAETDMRRFGYAILALTALVLVVACTNLANLVLARGTMRQQEVAVRRALGASRWRLVREQCAESLLLATLGGIAAYLVLAALVPLLDTEVPFAPNWVVSLQPQINTPVLIATGGALLLSLLVFGFEPAMQLTRRPDVRDDLLSTAGTVGAPKAKRQRRLLRWQVAISAGFFIIASMTVRYVAEEAGHDSGIDLDRIAVGYADFYLQRWDEARVRRAVDRILEEARREPGVEAAAVSSGLPFGTTITPALLFARPDDPKLARGEREDATLVTATPEFFRTAGIAIRYGRGFTQRDDALTPPVVILSESTAIKTFGTANAVGRQLLARADPRRLPAAAEPPDRLVTVVGVAEDTDTTHFFLRRGNTAYVPFAQVYSPSLTIVVRAEDSSHGAGAIRRAVHRADPDVALSSAGIGTGRRILAGPYVFYRAAGAAAAALGGITLFLAMTGLYGVLSHIVSHRTREIGVRMSLGATRAQIRRMVLRDGYGPVVQGLAIGLFIGIAGRAVIRAFVVGRVEVVDQWMFTLAPIPLLLAAFVACFLPARRASRIDPNVALRHL